MRLDHLLSKEYKLNGFTVYFSMYFHSTLNVNYSTLLENLKDTSKK